MQFTSKTFIAGLLLGSVGFVPSVFASQEAPYLQNAEGAPVVAAGGGCVHSPSWNGTMPTCPEPTLVVEQGQAKIMFSVDDSEFFGFNKDQLNDKAKADLDAMVGAVQDADMIHGIDITGHADQIGPPPYNTALALKRAEAVKKYLVSQGIPADRINTASDGSSDPLVTCPGVDNEGKLIKCLAPNRRVDVVASLGNDVDVTSVSLAPPPN
jgi:outer membrane protein OmpA-like peptidoglycan-associated protein